jgi:type III restriction enzyme
MLAWKPPLHAVLADIVDPHGIQFSDALAKIQGMAKYAETHPSVYRRVETVAKIDETLRVLDLTNATVRKAVAESKDAKSLYTGPYANTY